jgi:membrane protein implicated in regulation of membrane protease activity
MFSDYLFVGNIWLIIGLLFIILELIDGSLVIFLPTGIGGLIVGIILKLQESNIAPIILIGLVWTLLAWAFLSVVISIIIRNIFKTKKPSEDINNY